MPQKVNLALIYERISHNNEILMEIKEDVKDNTAHRHRQTTVNKMIAGGFGVLTTIMAFIGNWI